MAWNDRPWRRSFFTERVSSILMVFAVATYLRSGKSLEKCFATIMVSINIGVFLGSTLRFLADYVEYCFSKFGLNGSSPTRGWSKEEIYAFWLERLALMIQIICSCWFWFKARYIGVVLAFDVSSLIFFPLANILYLLGALSRLAQKLKNRKNQKARKTFVADLEQWKEDDEMRRKVRERYEAESEKWNENLRQVTEKDKADRKIWRENLRQVREQNEADFKIWMEENKKYMNQVRETYEADLKSWMEKNEIFMNQAREIYEPLEKEIFRRVREEFEADLKKWMEEYKISLSQVGEKYEADCKKVKEKDEIKKAKEKYEADREQWEEEKDYLLQKLVSASESAGLYREMLHNLGCN